MLKKRRFKKSERGMAIVESIPMLFLMVVILSFSIGFFGAIHSGILNSIGSYNYAIETFRFRSDLMYLRPGNTADHYRLSNNRVHGVLAEAQENTNQLNAPWIATQRTIAYSYNPRIAEERLNESLEERGARTPANRFFGQKGQNSNIWTVDANYTPKTSFDIQTPKIWIKTVYGICINADCGEGS